MPDVGTSRRESLSGPSVSRTDFEAEARRLLADLRGSVARLIASGASPVTRATDLQRAWSIRAPLAWQIFRWATAEDPFATVTFIPKPEAMAKALAAAKAAGFDCTTVDEAAAGYQRLNNFIKQHAGERGAFDAMISALGHGSTPQIDLKHRRAAYRANTQIWGLSARTLYGACLYHGPNDLGMPTSSLVLKGLVGLRALRSFESVPLSKRYMQVEHRGTLIPLVTEFMIFEDFCSDLGEGIRSVHREGQIHDSLHVRGIGATSKTTVFIGVRVAELPIDEIDRVTATEEGVTLAIGSVIQVPCEEVVLDLLIPIESSTPAEPKLQMLAAIDDPLGVAAHRHEPDRRLPGADKGRYVGDNLEALRSPELPRCPELIRAAMRRAGWDDDRYHLYRARVPYPVLHSHASLEVRCRPRGEG